MQEQQKTLQELLEDMDKKEAPKAAAGVPAKAVDTLKVEAKQEQTYNRWMTG